LFFTVYLVLALALSTGVLLCLLYPEPLIIGICFGLVGIAGSLWWFLKAGRVKLAGWMLVCGLWVLVAMGTVFFGGVQSTSYWHLLVVICLATLVLGPWAGAAVTAASLCLGIGLLSAESGGWLPPELVQVGPFDRWIGHAQVAASMAVFMAVVAVTLKRLFRQSRAAHEALEETNMALRTQIAEREQAQQQHAEAQQQLLHARKMESIGTLASGIAHDTNNVLTVILANATLLREDMDPDNPQAEQMADLIAACERGQQHTRNLLGFARKGTYEYAPVSVNSTTDEVVRILKSTISKKVKLELWQLDPDMAVHGDAGQLSAALMNLCLNAVDAMDGDGRLCIDCTAVELTGEDVEGNPSMEPGLHAQIEVRDTGHGMGAELMERVFDPFFTTKKAGEGTGLGLAMVYGTMENHRGRIQVESKPALGTTFTLQLPAASGKLPTKEVSGRVSARVSVDDQQTILLVDDEELILRVGSRLLERGGFKAVTASTGLEAIDLVKKKPGRFALVILDMRMPELSGAETFDGLREVDAELPVLISSGDMEDRVVRQLQERGAIGVLAKPFTFEQFHKVVRKHLDTGDATG